MIAGGWQRIVAAICIAMVLFSGSASAVAQTPTTTFQDPAPPTDPDRQSNDGGFEGDEDAATPEGDATVTRTATFTDTEPPLLPTSDADLGTTDGEGNEVDAVDAGLPLSDTNCAEFTDPEYNEEGDFYYSAVCIRWRVCGAERVDDIVSGDISGSDATGRYAEYLGQVSGYLTAEATGPDGPLDVNSVNDLLISQGLGERPEDDLIPVFTWCALHDDEYNYEPIELDSVGFSWDLAFGDVYDIDGARNSLYGELTARLALYDPQPGAVPPLEGGHTFAQWPTWFFLENPLEQEHVYTTNDIDTFRIDLRATLLRIDWSFGDQLIASCGVDDMLVYDADTHDPIDDLPTCHHVFTELGTGDLVATIAYKIEEQIRSRPSASLHDYPDTPWVDYLGSPTEIELTTTASDYGIHEIVSVNVPITEVTDTAG